MRESMCVVRDSYASDLLLVLRLQYNIYNLLLLLFVFVCCVDEFLLKTLLSCQN
jgi:hypothetical protein